MSYERALAIAIAAERQKSAPVARFANDESARGAKDILNLDMLGFTDGDVIEHGEAEEAAAD
jgi:hypothetical protein